MAAVLANISDSLVKDLQRVIPFTVFGPELQYDLPGCGTPL